MFPVLVLLTVVMSALFYIIEVVSKQKVHFYDKIEKSIYAIVIAFIILYVNDLIYRGVLFSV